MYHKFIDCWDKRRAQRGNALKVETRFSMDAPLAFPALKHDNISISDFMDISDQAVSDNSFFSEPYRSNLIYAWANGWIEYKSDISTDVIQNSYVRVKVTGNSCKNNAIILFHHWNAKKRYDGISKFLSRRGATIFQIAMPYHFERVRPESLYADFMISPSLGRTLQSVRQAVLDGRKLVRILEQEGYSHISVLGISLGSWVAGLVAATDQAIRKAGLFLTAGSLADMVWTGDVTRHIRASLEGQISATQLDRVWAPANLGNYAEQLARPDLELQVVLARRDTVVLPQLAEPLLVKLNRAGARVDTLKLNCGHYSFSLPPYIIPAGLRTIRFLEG